MPLPVLAGRLEFSGTLLRPLAPLFSWTMGRGAAHRAAPSRGRLMVTAAAIGCWIVLGAVGIWAGMQLGTGSLAAPAAGLMPALAGAALVIFGVVALGQKLGEKVHVRTSASHRRLAAPLAAVALLFLYAVLFEKVGFVPSTFVLIVALARLAGSGGWVSALLLGAIASAASHLVFKLALGVPLP